MTNDAEWQTRYPGSWRTPVSMTTACFWCGDPGYVVPAPPTPLTVAGYDAPLEPPMIRTGHTCPGHEYVIRRALYEHPEWDRLDGFRLRGWRWQ